MKISPVRERSYSLIGICAARFGNWEAIWRNRFKQVVRYDSSRIRINFLAQIGSTELAQEQFSSNEIYDFRTHIVHGHRMYVDVHGKLSVFFKGKEFTYSQEKLYELANKFLSFDLDNMTKIEVEPGSFDAHYNQIGKQELTRFESRIEEDSLNQSSA